ncbi:ABC transporter ATP-binding protein [Echinimonas agarilytica]|uniref:ATP-binding cassette domain-containing protein n=1 Tax=Echinimonas agarilytica TaxID=1215918 RepID=A0AA41W7D7_9GAMM|nr:ATP-binding cassette domain-containing protein [Echinimonas agarilytica]MCM2680071.1 ATP-binding cassette domain-containing protein [Echinimonas agarilytica]
MLELSEISHWFDDQTEANAVVSHISLSLRAGKSLSLMGSSGSGKSTLLQIAAGLEPPKQGSVVLAGKPIYQLNDSALSQLRRNQLGFVFQQFNLIPGLSVADNILFQVRLNKQAHDAAWLQHLLNALELTELQHRQPQQLSGGQQQRVAIARALAHRPAILFADEPTGNLNDSLSHGVMQLLSDLVSEANTSLLMVTHSHEMAKYTDQVLHLHEGHLHASA